jgi:cytochrome P450
MLPEHRWDPYHPVGINPETGATDLSSYEDVERALTDPEAYSMQALPEDVIAAGELNLFRAYWSQDNPPHDEVQKHVAPSLRPAVVRQYLTTATQVATNDTVDRIRRDGSGHFDYMDTFGQIPKIVIAGYLGMDPYDKEVAQWLKDFNDLDTYTTPDQERRIHAKFVARLQECQETFPEGATPTNPVEALVAAQHAGAIVLNEEISDSLAAAQLQMLRSAGDHTTTMAIANALHGMSDHGVLEQLAAQPDPRLIRLANEEAMGRWPSFPFAWRVTKMPVTLSGGQKLKAGTLVNAWISAANYSRQHFYDPYGFVVDRDPNKHLSWGAGWSKCTGQYLGQMIMDTVVTAAVTRLPQLQWDGRESRRTRSVVPYIEVTEKQPGIKEGDLGFTYNPDLL